jgi:hypothetical protein
MGASHDEHESRSWVIGLDVGQSSGRGARTLRCRNRSAYGLIRSRDEVPVAKGRPASDIFFGWTAAANGRQLYVRQLHDAKIKPLVETFDAGMPDVYAQACGWVLARAHAKASATISGYLGSSSETFDIALGKFALGYADQAERDHAALKAAVRKGRTVAVAEP